MGAVLAFDLVVGSALSRSGICREGLQIQPSPADVYWTHCIPTSQTLVFFKENILLKVVIFELLICKNR